MGVWYGQFRPASPRVVRYFHPTRFGFSINFHQWALYSSYCTYSVLYTGEKGPLTDLNDHRRGVFVAGGNRREGVSYILTPPHRGPPYRGGPQGEEPTRDNIFVGSALFKSVWLTGNGTKMRQYSDAHSTHSLYNTSDPPTPSHAWNP